MNEKTKDRAKTSYAVLRATGVNSSDGPGDRVRAWETIAEVEAANAQDAIRQAAKGAEGVYVAVPARSWQPVTVKVETRTVVKLT